MVGEESVSRGDAQRRMGDLDETPPSLEPDTAAGSP